MSTSGSEQDMLSNASDAKKAEDIESTSSDAPLSTTAGNVSAASAAEAEKKLAHYKRLIVQSRQMLENYQKQLADKEKALSYSKQESSDLIERIKQLEQQQKKSLHSGVSSSSGGDGVKSPPLQARRRVNDDVDGSIWVLFEYENDRVEWRRFSDEVSVNDYVRRDTGEPIVVPPPSLGVEEAAQLVANSEKAVAKITDEFKRYRVKSEIMRKQKDAEAKQASSISIQAQRRQIHGDSSNENASALEKRANKAEAQVEALLEEMAEKEDKWQSALAELKREKEKILAEGSEAPIAAQWRQRFEQCHREKSDLLARLNQSQNQSPSSSLSSVAVSHSPNTHVSASEGTAPLDDMPRRFAELRDEYKLYRKRAMEAIAEKEMTIASLRGGSVKNGMHRSSSIEDPKLQYLKNLMLKYLCTDEFEAKEHMERAITTVLLFSEAERNFVAERRADASASWLVNWMGNQANNQ